MTKPEPGLHLSVIIPTYNRAAAIGAAIDSVLLQVPPPDEVIVVDDGSTDDTGAVLAGYGGRIRAIRRKNGGAGAARNTGLAAARGQWVAFLDSDDLWVPGRLEALHRDLQAADDDVVAHTGNLRITGPGYDRDVFATRGWSFPVGGARKLICPLKETLTGVHPPTTALRRDAALAEGGFREDRRIYEDAPLFCGLALRGPWLFTGDILAEARRLPEDGAALSSLEHHEPVEATLARAQFACELLDRDDLPDTLRSFVRRKASGELFALAAAKKEAGLGSARRTLIRSAQLHPSYWAGWARALPPLLFGRSGYRLALARRKTFTRANALSRR